MSKYHEAFVPFPDVYEQGGPDVFKQLERKEDEKDSSGEKNLVVIPFSFIENLSQMEKENSMGASDSLVFIKNIGEKRNRNEEKHYVIYSVVDGLDICVIDDEKYSKQDFSVSELEKLIKENFKPDENPTLITSDNKTLIKYNNRGLSIEEPKFLQISEDIVYEGIIQGTDELYARLLKNKEHSIKLEEAVKILERELYLNQFVRFGFGENKYYAVVSGNLTWNNSRNRITGSENNVLRLIHEGEYGKKLHFGNRREDHYVTDKVLGIKPLDMEQYLAFQYGMIPNDVSMFFLCGKAGSGKTLLSYVYAVDSVLWYEKEARIRRGLTSEKGGLFRNIILLKATEILGGKRRELGFMPGDFYDKLKRHLSSYSDAHKECILGDMFPFEEMFKHPEWPIDRLNLRNPELKDRKINDCAYIPPRNEIIELEYSGYIGGRSIKNTLLIIDEAQDYTPYELKTILERLAPGSAALILGDHLQIRNPKCTIKRNGLTFAIKTFLPKPYSALMYLTKNYRHQISEDAEGMRVYND